MDGSVFVIQGVSLVALVFGIVEFIKDTFNLQGKIVTVISLCTGAVLMIIYQLIPLLPQPYEQIVNIVVLSLAFGLSASGFYKFAAARTTKQV